MSWNYKPSKTSIVYIIDLDKKTNMFAPRKKFKVDVEKYNKRNPDDKVKMFEEIDDCQYECDKLNLATYAKN